tara:strand:- start:196 stop:561 length:366 start_codon:yes stop_codon:yes gene_type:complete
MNKPENIFSAKLAEIKAEGLYKKERTITTPQGVIIATREGGEVLNFCANNYLGLSNNAEIKAAAQDALENHGFGMSSVRFICVHRTSIRNWNERFQIFSTPMTPSCIHPVLMPMVVYLKHY